MADNLEKKPSKGILKSSSSFEQPDAPAPVKKKHKETKWDEMNIIATLHPADKDYGHMKIEEPKTPYNWEEGAEGEEPDGIDANLLAEKIRLGANEPAKVFREEDEDDEDDVDDEESPEDRAQRKVFESKRKAHYNEYYAVKLARKLMDKEGDDDETEGDDDNDADTAEKADSEPSEKSSGKCCKNKTCKPSCTHRRHKSSKNNDNANCESMPGSSHDRDEDGCDQV